MTERIAAVFFDLDDTLIHDGEAAAVRRAAAGIAERLSVSPQRVLDANAEAARACWEENGAAWMRGEMPGDLLPRMIWRRALAVLDAADRDLVDTAVELHLEGGIGDVHLFSDTVDVLSAVRSEGMLTGLITNGPADIQRAKLAQVGITSSFDVIVASGDVGILKPDPEIFRRALEMAGADPRTAVHIGDNFAADIVGATGVGARAIWINPTRARIPDDDVLCCDAASLTEALAFVRAGARPQSLPAATTEGQFR